jgi:hypothetical protein
VRYYLASTYLLARICIDVLPYLYTIPNLEPCWFASAAQSQQYDRLNFGTVRSTCGARRSLVGKSIDIPPFVDDDGDERSKAFDPIRFAPKWRFIVSACSII